MQKNILNNVKAEIIFLGIGLLSKQADSDTDLEEHIGKYWTNTVLTTTPSRENSYQLVIPIHWDDFTLPLDPPLKSSYSYIDDVARTVKILEDLARESENILLMFPPTKKSINYNSFINNH
jgi:hypothetical protein